MTSLKEVVTFANRLKGKDLIWKPMYPNNMKYNGENGLYAIIYTRSTNGDVNNCRKYTILYQHTEVKPGTGMINPNYIDKYILFEKRYPQVFGEPYYDGPWESEPPDLWRCQGKTFSSCDMNDYGSFVYAYDTLEHAIKRAETQYRSIYGYAMSHLLGDDEIDQIN